MSRTTSRKLKVKMKRKLEIEKERQRTLELEIRLEKLRKKNREYDQRPVAVEIIEETPKYRAERRKPVVSKVERLAATKNTMVRRGTMLGKLKAAIGGGVFGLMGGLLLKGGLVGVMSASFFAAASLFGMTASKKLFEN